MKSFRIECLRKQVGRLWTFKQVFFSKLYFWTGVAVVFEKFVSDWLKILPVSIKLNYLQKYVGFFRNVENYSRIKAFFNTLLREKKFQNVAIT